MAIHNNTQQRADLIGPLLNLKGVSEDAPVNILLDTVELVALHALEGLQSFKSGALDLFDPSIGDECCQLRALMMLQFASQGYPHSADEDIASMLLLQENMTVVREKIALFDREIEETQTAAASSRAGIRKKKNDLNSEKDRQLEVLQRGSDAANDVMEAFKKKMQKLTLEEKPIIEALGKRVKEIRLQQREVVASLQAPLSQTARLIAIAYLLTKIKKCELEAAGEVHVLHDKIELGRIKIEGKGFNGTLVASIMERAKVILNRESVAFIRKEASALTCKRAPLLIKATAETLPSAKKDFGEVSFYHGCEVVMKRVKELGIAVLFKARGPKDVTEAGAHFTCSQLFCLDKESGKYVPVSKKVSDQPVLVIEGISKHASREGLLAQIEAAGGIMKVVRYNLAQHRLCTAHERAEPSLLLSAQVIDGKECEKIETEKTIACMSGYSTINYDRFRIEHMFAALLSSQKL